VGEAMQSGTVSLVINSISYPDQHEYIELKDGYQFISVDVTIENKGSSDLEIFSSYNMILKDPQGWTYSEEIGANMMNLTLTPGEKIRGQVVYMVPRSATGLVFSYDDNIYEKGRILIAIP
jgi:hypothetical protein